MAEAETKKKSASKDAKDEAQNTIWSRREFFSLAGWAGFLASLGLSALGLGPQNEPSIGLTIFWVLHYGALIRELWWWFMPPIIVMVLLFIGLFMITAGLDRIANPRLRTTV